LRADGRIHPLALGHELRVFQARVCGNERGDRHGVPAAVVFDFLQQVGASNAAPQRNPAMP